MVLEWARNMCGLAGANSTEFDQYCDNPAVIFMPEISTTHMGGTMRLGSRRTVIAPDTMAFQLYEGHSMILERHRHRYEVNPEMIKKFTEAGLVFSGKDTKGERMEIAELPDHPFYIGTQFHPEFQSRPFTPSPPFIGFVQASSGVFVRKNPTAADPNAILARPGSSTGGGSRKHPSMDPRRLKHSKSLPELPHDPATAGDENVSTQSHA